MSDPIAETWDRVLEEEDRAAREIVSVDEIMLKADTRSFLLLVTRKDGSRDTLEVHRHEAPLIDTHAPPRWFWKAWLNQERR